MFRRRFQRGSRAEPGPSTRLRTDRGEAPTAFAPVVRSDSVPAFPGTLVRFATAPVGLAVDRSSPPCATIDARHDESINAVENRYHNEVPHLLRLSSEHELASEPEPWVDDQSRHVSL